MAELLAELRRVEAVSAAEEQAAQDLSEEIERGLERAEDLLKTSQADVQAALEFLDSTEQQLQEFASIRDAVERHEAAARTGLQALVDASVEVCALDTGPQSGEVSPEALAGLEGSLSDAESSFAEVRASRTRCEEGTEELRTEIREWQERWQTAIQEATAAVEKRIEEAGAALIEAITKAESLGSSAIRLGELGAEAEPVVAAIEERAGAWSEPALAEMRGEVLTEARRLGGQIGDRVTAALDSYDHQTGSIENLKNELDLTRHDLDGLARETSRVREDLRPRLSEILSRTDRTAESAAESAAQADWVWKTAQGCLERVRDRAGVEEATPQDAPDVAYFVVTVEGSGYKANYAGETWVISGSATTSIRVPRGQGAYEVLLKQYRGIIGDDRCARSFATQGMTEDSPGWPSLFSHGPKLTIVDGPYFDREEFSRAAELRENWKLNSKKGPDLFEIYCKPGGG